MKEIVGRFATARVFTDCVDEGALEQVRALCDLPSARGARIRVMPDAHAGAGCAIGTTMTVSDRVVPNLVGVDIGCGMLATAVGRRDPDWGTLDRLIRDRIPSGPRVRRDPHPLAEQAGLHELRCAGQVDLARARMSLGTLGGGNHFIEADRDEDGRLWLVIHSGSRRLGLEAARLYQRLGFEALRGARSGGGKGDRREKKARRAGEREAEGIPYDLCHVEGKLFDDYLHDLNILQRFARLNRRAMMDEILRGLKLEPAEEFSTIHNYVDMEAMILRKGAVSAREGELLLIPVNMRDGSLLCRGKGNPDWNFSAPHGAGRLYSRSQAKAKFSLGEFRKQMEGVYTSSVRADTLDECPMAYKPLEGIITDIAPTAEVLKVLRPVYNFKAGGD